MITIPPKYRFHHGEDPEINEVLSLDWRDRTTASLAGLVQRGMDVHELLQYWAFYTDPDLQEKTDVVKLLQAGLHFATPEGLHRVIVTRPEWVYIVEALDRCAKPSDIRKCLTLLRSAGVRFDTYNPIDDQDPLMSFEVQHQIQQMVILQRIEHEVAALRATLTEVAEESEGTVPAAGRRRL